MPKKSTPKRISRRTFLKNVGAGTVGGAVLLPVLEHKVRDREAASTVEPERTEELTFRVNGKSATLMVAPQTTLAEVLRNQLHLTGTKIACNHGECGNCTVLVDDRAVYACHMLALDVAGKSVTTIEGLLTGEELNRTQQAFVEKDGLQCGFCTPGQIMAAEALLRKYPRPTRRQIEEGLSGTLCRCSAYPKIIDSVLAAAEISRG